MVECQLPKLKVASSSLVARSILVSEFSISLFHDKPEAQKGDGDFHVRLELEPGQNADLINARNIAGQHGVLVFGPICVNDLTQKSVQTACRVKQGNLKKHSKQKISLPNVGDHVKATPVSWCKYCVAN